MPAIHRRSSTLKTLPFLAAVRPFHSPLFIVFVVPALSGSPYVDVKTTSASARSIFSGETS